MFPNNKLHWLSFMVSCAVVPAVLGVVCWLYPAGLQKPASEDAAVAPVSTDVLMLASGVVVLGCTAWGLSRGEWSSWSMFGKVRHTRSGTPVRFWTTIGGMLGGGVSLTMLALWFQFFA